MRTGIPSRSWLPAVRQILLTQHFERLADCFEAEFKDQHLATSKINAESGAWSAIPLTIGDGGKADVMIGQFDDFTAVMLFEQVRPCAITTSLDNDLRHISPPTSAKVVHELAIGLGHPQPDTQPSWRRLHKFDTVLQDAATLTAGIVSDNGPDTFLLEDGHGQTIADFGRNWHW